MRAHISNIGISENKTMRLLLVLAFWLPLVAADFGNPDFPDFIEENEKENLCPQTACTTTSISADSNDTKKDGSTNTVRSVTQNHPRSNYNFKNLDELKKITQPQIILCHVALAIFEAAGNLGIGILRLPKMLCCGSSLLNGQPHARINMPTLVLG